jgi:hypothetical protein
MAGRSSWKLIACLGIYGLAAGAFSPALAAFPSDPCNIEPVPTGQNGAVEITPRSFQPQRGWQRQGRDIDISIRSPKVPDKGSMRVFVCFRWEIDSDSSADIKPFQKFVQSGSTGGPAPIEKSGQLKLTATVPNNLPGAPVSPQDPQADKVTGIYARNNAYPLADVRILAFGDGDTPILDLIQPFGVIAADVYCDMPLTDTTVAGGVGDVSEHKNWQPEDGVFEFTVKTAPKTIPTSSLVKVCFRWKLDKGDPGPFYESGPTHMLDTQPQSIKVAATVLSIPNKPKRWAANTKSKGVEQRVGAYAIPIVGLVPQADARIIIIDSDGSPLADVLTTVGVTNLYFACIIVLFTVVLAFVILWRVGKHRLSPIPRCNPLLRIITTRRGFASLSQFQIILWTFVVIASAAYVMALSGDLIEITTGTLVLLGISGSATVISKAKSEQVTAPPPIDPATAAAASANADEEARKLRTAAALATGEAKIEAEGAAAEAEAIATAAKAKVAAADAVVDALKRRAAVADAPADQKQAAADDAKRAEDVAQQKLKDAAIADEAAKKSTRLRHPRWSDLVMEEIQGRELDVTRIQMLYFTLVTATFVLLKVITSYEIPVIPEGFLLLMGISNSVYVGSKFAANPASK